MKSTIDENKNPVYWQKTTDAPIVKAMKEQTRLAINRIALKHKLFEFISETRNND